jgi:hypothetical protein
MRTKNGKQMTCTAPPPVGAVLVVQLRQPAVLVRAPLLALHLRVQGVAVQVEFKSKALKPGYHLTGTIQGLKPRAFGRYA